MISKEKYYSINIIMGAIFLISLLIYAWILIILKLSPDYIPHLFVIYGFYSLVSSLYFKKTMLAYGGHVSGDYAYLFWGLIDLLIPLTIAIYLLQAKYSFNKDYFWIAVFSILIIPILIVWIKYKLNKRKRKEIALWRLPWE